MADTPTPASPGTYLPVPGQTKTTNDTANAAQSSSQNSTTAQAAAPFNGGVVVPDGTGNTYTKNGNTTVAATTGPAIITALPVESGGKGDKGDKGDTGPRGLTGPVGPQGAPGPAGVVDMDALRAIIQGMIDDSLNVKVLEYIPPVATQVYGTKVVNLPVELYNPLDNSKITVLAAYTLGAPSTGSITSGGVFTAANVPADTSTTVIANYVDSKGKNYTASTNLAVKALKIVSLTISGPTTINSAGSGTYAATVSYTDGSTKVVTGLSGLSWTATPGGIGTMTANVLTAPVVGANVSGSVNASYVEGGLTVTATKAVTIAAPQIQAFYGFANAPATGSAYNSYALWSDFVLALGSRGTSGTRANTVTIVQGASQYGWYAYPASYGLATFTDASNNFQGGWDGAGNPPSISSATGPKSITVTINGASVPFYLYRTDQPNIGSKTWVVS